MNNYEILINKENKIAEEFYKNFELIEVLNVEMQTIKIEKTTYEKYCELKKRLQKENIELGILNSFRDFKEQEEILKEYIEIYGYEEAHKLAAIPGTSEHHSGLAIDITIKMSNGEFALTNEELYSEDEKFKIVHKFLKDLGFILRYHKGKEEITKYSYEPWHIRYVGERIAQECADKNIVLEEYYQMKNM